MFTVYLAVDFFQLYIDIMQKPLNTYSFALCPPLLRMLSTAKAGLLGCLTMLLLVGLANQAKAATGFDSNYVTIGSSLTTPTTTTPSGTYYTNKSGSLSSTAFGISRTLGSFDRGRDMLTLSGISTTTDQGNQSIQSVVLFYRVYLASAPIATIPPYQGLGTIPKAGKGNDPTTWTTTGQINLLNATSGAGTYVVEFYYQAIIVDKQGNIVNKVYDYALNGVTPYSASFTVSGSQALLWTGNANDGDWFTEANWLPNGKPTKDTDVTIPYINGATVNAYPHVSFDVAQVRTLNILGNTTGTTSTIGARLSLNGGELQVYGDFQDLNSGFSQSSGLFTLAGTDQRISGGAFSEVRVQGGGNKTIANKMEISRSLTFESDNLGSKLVTRTETPISYSVDLLGDATVN
jgi:hypothetical protein